MFGANPIGAPYFAQGPLVSSAVIPIPPAPQTPGGGGYRRVTLQAPSRAQRLPPPTECAVVLSLPRIRPELFAQVAIERLSVEAAVSLEMAMAALASDLPVGLERRAMGAQLVIGLPEIGPSVKALLAIARRKKRS